MEASARLCCARAGRPAGTTPALNGPRADGMVGGMATRKITVTLEEGQLDRIRALVESGSAPSVSGFVQHAVSIALDDVAGWGAMLADGLRATGGRPSTTERRWADEALGVGGRRRKAPAA